MKTKHWKKQNIEKSVFHFCCFIWVLNFPLKPLKSICLQASRTQNPQWDLTVYFWSICIPLKCVSLFQSAAAGLKVIQMSVWKVAEWLSDSAERTHLSCLKLESKEQRRWLSAVVRGFLSHINPFRHMLRWNYKLMHKGRMSLEAQHDRRLGFPPPMLLFESFISILLSWLSYRTGTNRSHCTLILAAVLKGSIFK